MSRTSLVVALVLFVALFNLGCGGSGGGSGSGPNNSTISYQTIWNGVGGGPNGLSQRIQVFNDSGVLMDSHILNKAGVIDNVTLAAMPAGTYLVTVELNSALNFTGVVTGVTSIVLEIDGNTPFVSKVGEVPTHISVSPDTANITEQQSQQFAVTPLDANDEAVFVDPSGISWSTLGGVASVSSSGVVLGTSPGTGSVKATFVPLALTDAAVLNVTAFTPVHKKWTVLVFLNAANDLDEFGDLNVNQMERVAGGDDVRFIVQWKQAVIPGESTSPSFVGTRRYELQHDTTSNNLPTGLIQDMGTGVDMGDWHTLRDFIDWGQTFYPADRYVLVIWNHGNGWHRAMNRTQATRGVSYDDDMGTSIETWQLNQALGTSHVDILAWDASLMQMLEVNNEIRDKVDFLVGSEESPPAAGYPYDTIFQHFVDSPDLSSLNLAHAFVDETLDVPSYATEKITQSVLDSSKLDELSSAVDQLGSALKAEATVNSTDFALYIQTARLNAQTYSQSSARTYRDLIDLTLELDKTVGAYSPPASITTANTAVRTAAGDAIVYEGHNSHSPESHGISIDFSPQSRFVNYQSDYSLLKLANDTQWNEWLSVAP